MRRILEAYGDDEYASLIGALVGLLRSIGDELADDEEFREWLEELTLRAASPEEV